MQTSSLVVTPDERWTSLHEIGSPFSLLRLVADLKKSDQILGRHLLTIDEQLQSTRDETFLHCFTFAWTLMEMLSMRRIASRYAERMDLPPEKHQVPDLIDETITKIGSVELLDRVIDVAQNCRPSDYSIRVLRGRVRELAGDAAGSLEEYEPGSMDVGAGAFEVFRRGYRLRDREKDEAERLFALAIRAEPSFSLAYRGYADMIRRKDPKQAAAHYLAALEHMPRLHYGGTNAAAGSRELRVLGQYRNFLLTMKGKTYVAYPAASGDFDLSSEQLTRSSRRLAGLFLLRLRFRDKLSLQQGGDFRRAPVAVPRWRRSVARYFGKGRFARYGTRPGAMVSTLRSATPTVRFGIVGYLRLRRGITTCTTRVKRLMVRRFIGWVGRNFHLFQFVLTGNSLDDLKRQIDAAYDRWLSTAR